MRCILNLTKEKGNHVRRVVRKEMEQQLQAREIKMKKEWEIREIKMKKELEAREKKMLQKIEKLFINYGFNSKRG